MSAARDATQKARRYPAADIAWLPVIPNPDKILCIGLNYETHRKETGRTEVENPTVFGRFANSQTGHLADIIRPTLSHDLDYEGELAVIIGKPGDTLLAPTPGATSPAMPATTKAACVIFSAIRINSRRARTFRGPALSVPG